MGWTASLFGNELRSFLNLEWFPGRHLHLQRRLICWITLSDPGVLAKCYMDFPSWARTQRQPRLHRYPLLRDLFLTNFEYLKRSNPTAPTKHAFSNAMDVQEFCFDPSVGSIKCPKTMLMLMWSLRFTNLRLAPSFRYKKLKCLFITGQIMPNHNISPSLA